MSRIVHTLVQGSPEWHQHRAAHYNASDVPVMLGICPYKKRSELVREYATGIRPEVDERTQVLFDKGHEYEALARSIAEKILGEVLYPQVHSLVVNDISLPLSASLDGITMAEDILFEHKSSNADLRRDLDDSQIDDQYASQMEQQLLVSGAEKCLFMASNGTEATEQHLFYLSKPALRARIIDGWKQFDVDVKNYKQEPSINEVVAEPIKSLPALRIELSGSVLASNLIEYESTALLMIDGIKTELSTDQDFADAEAMVKFCDGAEKELETVKKLAQSQASSIDDLFRSIDNIREKLRSKRLTLSRKVTSRKEEIREEIISKARGELDSYINLALNPRIGKPYMPHISTDFAGVIKGKKLLSSIQDAVDTELRRAKFEAGSIADRIAVNLKYLELNAVDFRSLFPDEASIVTKAEDDFAALVKTRITEHKEAEAKRANEKPVTVAKDNFVTQAFAAIADGAITPIESTKLPSKAEKILAEIVSMLQDMSVSELSTAQGLIFEIRQKRTSKEAA